MSITRYYKGDTTGRPRATRPAPHRPDDTVIPRACTTWRRPRGRGCDGAQTRLHWLQARCASTSIALARGADAIRTGRIAPAHRAHAIRTGRIAPAHRAYAIRTGRIALAHRAHAFRAGRIALAHRAHAFRIARDRVCKPGSWPVPGAKAPAPAADAFCTRSARACTMCTRASRRAKPLGTRDRRLSRAVDPVRAACTRAPRGPELVRTRGNRVPDRSGYRGSDR
jgi:hypothetical protein